MSAPCCTLVLCEGGTGTYFTGGEIPGIPAGGDGWNEGGREKEGGGEGLRPRGWLGHPSPLALILSPHILSPDI